MQNDYSHLINAVMRNLDWDTILGVYKMFKKGVGCESMIIPGVKRKPNSDDLTVKDIKHELKSLIKLVMTKGSGEVNYGLWIVNWYNSDEQQMIEFLDEENEEYDDSEEELEFQAWFPTKLQVILAPQIISVIENLQTIEETTHMPSPTSLENMLEEAIKKEDYELANKLKAVISHKTKNKNKEDK